MTSWAVLIYDCAIGGPPGAPWQAGPLPLGTNDVSQEISDRTSYYHPRAAEVLYGGDEGCRWHRVLEEPQALEGTELIAGELLSFPGPDQANGLAVVHLRLTGELAGSSLDALRGLVHYRADAPSSQPWLSTWLQPHATLAATNKRAFCAVFAHAGLDLPDLHAGMAIRPDWDPYTQWMFHLAAATPPDKYPPHPASAADLMQGRLALSADWEALVLRDGAAFLMYPHQSGFADSAERYFRSIYTDAFLLGGAQRIRLHQIADRLARLADPERSVRPLLQLHQEVTTFRNSYWWQHVTGHGPANDLLRAYQQQHRLGEIASQIFTGLAESADQARIVAAERQSEQSARGNALIGLVTIVGLPFGIALALVQALNAKPCQVWAAMGMAAVVAVLLATTDAGQTALAPLLPWRKRTEGEG
jgi:hypothetical protein